MEFILNNYYNMNPSMDYSKRIEEMYPDSYTKVYPQVEEIVSSISDERMYNLTKDDMDYLTGEAIKRSHIQNSPHGGHNRDTLGDLARSLIIRALFDRHRRHQHHHPGFPYFYPHYGRHGYWY